MPKVHDLSFLLNQVKKIVKEQKGIEISHEFLVMADSLSKYGVAPRYPNEIEVNVPQTEKALQNSAEIIDWVKMVVATPID